MTTTTKPEDLTTIGEPAASDDAPKNLFTQAQMANTATQKFDLKGAAGEMAAPEEYKPDDKSLVASQLTSILKQDSPYIQLARTRAAQESNARGLLNSSMAAGAGEAAAIDRALPIAQSDAGTFAEAGKYNAEAKNLFSRDANNFMREGALGKLNATNDMERLGVDMAFKRDERIADFNQTLEKLGFESKLRLSNVPIEFSLNIARTTQDSVNQILQDPDLSPEAKQAAITNLVNYSNQSMAWAEQFFGVNSITRLNSGFDENGFAAAPAAPAGATPPLPVPEGTQSAPPPVDDQSAYDKYLRP